MVVWTGNGTFWSVPANWSPAGVPHSGDVVSFGADGITSIVDLSVEVAGITFEADSALDLLSVYSAPGGALTLSGPGIVNHTASRPKIFVAPFQNGSLTFSGLATAADSLIEVFGASAPGAQGGTLSFTGDSTAGSAQISIDGGDGAGRPGAVLTFSDAATAGSADITVKKGSSAGQDGHVIFTGEATAEGATMFFNEGGTLDISGTTQGTGIGSLEGAAHVWLGERHLTVGHRGLEDVFSGSISGSGQLTKVGTGTLVLSGSNAFTGDTNVLGGTMVLANTAEGNDTLTGNLAIDGGAVRLDAGEQLADTSSVLLRSGSFDMGGFGETVGSFTNLGGTFSTGFGRLTADGEGVTWAGGTNTVSAFGSVIAAHVLVTGGDNLVEGGDFFGGVLEILAGAGGGLALEGPASPTIALGAGEFLSGSLVLGGNVSVNAAGTAAITSVGTGFMPGRIDLAGAERVFTVADGPSAVDLLITASLENGSFIKAGAGTLQFDGALPVAVPVRVTGGSVLLAPGNGDIFDNGTAVFLDGGGLAATGSVSEVLGQLSLLSESRIDFGNGSALLEFSSANATMWTGALHVLNWTGGVDQLRFDSPGGLDAAQLGSIQFFSDNGTTPLGSGAVFEGNQLVPDTTSVPEPSGTAALLLAAGAVTLRRRRRLSH